MKIRRYILLVAIVLIVSLLSISFTDNRISLKMHLSNCDYPKTTKNIKITERLSAWELILRTDCNSQADFEIDEASLLKWIEVSNFEIIHYLDSEQEKEIFIEKNEANIRLNELNGLDSFTFQFRHSNGSATIISINRSTKNSTVLCKAYYSAT